MVGVALLTCFSLSTAWNSAYWRFGLHIGVLATAFRQLLVLEVLVFWARARLF